MVIKKTWAMPNGRTFTIKPINEFIVRNIEPYKVIVDPFAKDSTLGTIRNDLNPDCDTQYHMDALTFLESLPDNSADCVLYDPPYSITQAAEHYSNYGSEKLKVSPTNMKYWSLVKDNCARILRTGGGICCFGWNTMGLGKKRGFDMKEILIVSHGGSRNDTLCTYEVKVA